MKYIFRRILILFFICSNSFILKSQTFIVNKMWVDKKSPTSNQWLPALAANQFIIPSGSKFVFNTKEKNLYIFAGKFGAKYEILSQKKSTNIASMDFFSGICKDEKGLDCTYLVIIDTDKLTGTVMVQDEIIQWNYEFELEDQKSYTSGPRYKIQDQSLFFKKSSETNWRLVGQPSQTPNGSFFLDKEDLIQIFIPGQATVYAYKSEQIWNKNPKAVVDDNVNYYCLTWNGLGDNLQPVELKLMHDKKDNSRGLMLSYITKDPNLLFMYGYTQY